MMRAGAAQARRPTSAPIAFDVSDLLDHFGAKRTPTGIQRVQASIVGAALRSSRDSRYLAFDRDRAAWRAVPPSALASLIALSSAGAATDDPDWLAARDAVTEAIGAAPSYGFADGTVLVNLGNSWGFADYFRGLRTVQRGSQVLYVPFLHDCVPLVMPEHCVRGLVRDYARWFSAMGVHAHAVLCNSECTRADGRRFLAQLLPGLDLPMEVVRLDGDPRGNAAPDPSALEGTRAPRPPERYVLFVATLESRKDHLTVFRAWLTLLRRHGPARIPRLVCVGSKGWHAEAAMNLLSGSPELSQHVLVLHGISDGGLAALYQGCSFTLYNSHHEGWGLPVTESLAWGKVPVVPNHSALVESADGLGVMVAPQSEADMVAAVERLLFESGVLEAQQGMIASRGPLRSWEAVHEQIVAMLDSFASRPAVPPEDRITLPLGTQIAIRRSDAIVPDPAIALCETMRDGPGWGPPEDWGSPIAGGVARLRVPVAGEAGGRLRLHLELRAPADAGPLRLAVLADGVPCGDAALVHPPEGDFASALSVTTPPDPHVLEVELECGPGFGLRGLMLCREDDLLARLGFLEAQRFAGVAGS
jgi:glycosyltransferase involved in cell wall biosynthesis